MGLARPFEDQGARQMVAVARAEEIFQNSPATGFTLLKFRRTPIDMLVRDAKIGQRELRAAQEFSWVFEDITRGLHFGDVNQMQRMDQSIEGEKPPSESEIAAWQHYKSFCNHWSALRKRVRNPLLSVFVAAVVDQQPFDHIAEDNGLTVKQCERMVIRGLRDYARRAGI